MELRGRVGDLVEIAVEQVAGAVRPEKLRLRRVVPARLQRGLEAREDVCLHRRRALAEHAADVVLAQLRHLAHVGVPRRAGDQPSVHRGDRALRAADVGHLRAEDASAHLRRHVVVGRRRLGDAGARVADAAEGVVFVSARLAAAGDHPLEVPPRAVAERMEQRHVDRRPRVVWRELPRHVGRDPALRRRILEEVGEHLGLHPGALLCHGVRQLVYEERVLRRAVDLLVGGHAVLARLAVGLQDSAVLQRDRRGAAGADADEPVVLVPEAERGDRVVAGAGGVDLPDGVLDRAVEGVRRREADLRAVVAELDPLRAVERAVGVFVGEELDHLAGARAVSGEAVGQSDVGAVARAPDLVAVDGDRAVVAEVGPAEPSAAAGSRALAPLAPAHHEVRRLVVDRPVLLVGAGEDDRRVVLQEGDRAAEHADGARVDREPERGGVLSGHFARHRAADVDVGPVGVHEVSVDVRASLEPLDVLRPALRGVRRVEVDPRLRGAARRVGDDRQRRAGDLGDPVLELARRQLDRPVCVGVEDDLGLGDAALHQREGLPHPAGLRRLQHRLRRREVRLPLVAELQPVAVAAVAVGPAPRVLRGEGDGGDRERLHGGLVAPRVGGEAEAHVPHLADVRPRRPVGGVADLAADLRDVRGPDDVRGADGLLGHVSVGGRVVGDLRLAGLGLLDRVGDGRVVVEHVDPVERDDDLGVAALLPGERDADRAAVLAGEDLLGHELLGLRAAGVDLEGGRRDPLRPHLRVPLRRAVRRRRDGDGGDRGRDGRHEILNDHDLSLSVCPAGIIPYLLPMRVCGLPLARRNMV